MIDDENDAQPYNPGHQLEGLDRCHTIMTMISELLIDHPAVLKAGVTDAVGEAQGLIMDAYQKIGAMDDDHELTDLQLLNEALDSLQYVTYHDGRYRQEQNSAWQSEAQPLVHRLAKRLGRKPYEGFGQ